ncbi:MULTISPECIES: sugar transferase [Nostocales]|uniref:Sugar transferase n=3 Tax=Nostocales TaxID=1161 RepID=A0A0C1N317_9CYAN|nr:sugar transferase [Tolypothrix bouteillei]KAF3885348.1 sugar transferase [Tolypothrix bouteillei VB521301]
MSNLSTSHDIQTNIQTSVLKLTNITGFAELSVHHSVSSKAKRFIDILGAIVGLSITAVLAIPIAIAIQLDNPGPIFYSQIRCGLNGRSFKIWKFRSMVVRAEELKHLVHNEVKGHYIFKNANDPRITRVGAFLRRTSLDELPQFWNVLLGEMSLVGTRPPTPDEVMHYSMHHWQRLNVKPGMTGEWQANGRSSIKDFEDIVRMDLNYQQQWSIAYDLGLILKTLKIVFQKSGAY